MKRKTGIFILILALALSLLPAGAVFAKTNLKSFTVQISSDAKEYKKTLKRGTKIQVVAKEGLDKIAPSHVKFSSSKKSVAAINKKGILTAKKPGTTVITVKNKHKKAQITITVTDKKAASDSREAKTIKNYFRKALIPVGKVLYVWGGGWYDSDRKGLPSRMVKWFNAQTPDYDFHDYDDLSYANRSRGFDCSGYLGWCLYQIMHKSSGDGGDYTVVSGEVGTAYQEWGFGTAFSQRRLALRSYALNPGDVGFKDGHCFIVLGQCKDKSAVILQSTPQAGVQISGTATPKGKKNSQAVALAKKYMKKYYPRSTAKYKYRYYAGHFLSEYNFFRWNNTTLADPDGYRKKSAEDVLKDLFSSAS